MNSTETSTNPAKEDEPPPMDMGGNTIFTRSRNLERTLGFGNIYLKFEGGNPTGTQKDRVSVYHVRRCINEGKKAITVGTCGNYGVSITYFASQAGLRSVLVIPEKYQIPASRRAAMTKMGAEVIYCKGEYEEAVELSHKLAREQGLYDANPGIGEIGWEGYKSISYEIVSQLGRVPTAVAVPVGNGTTLAGIYHGFKELLKQGKIDRMPHIVGGSTTGGNPVIKSFKEGASKVCELRPDEIHETPINEPLISYRAYDGDEALNAIYDTEGWADYVSDSRMQMFHNLIKDLEGLNVLPASTSGLEALLKFKKHRQLNSEYVIVLTGRKFR